MEAHNPLPRSPSSQPDVPQPKPHTRVQEEEDTHSYADHAPGWKAKPGPPSLLPYTATLQKHSGSITDTKIQWPSCSTFSFKDLGKEAV